MHSEQTILALPCSILIVVVWPGNIWWMVCVPADVWPGAAQMLPDGGEKLHPVCLGRLGKDKL